MRLSCFDRTVLSNLTHRSNIGTGRQRSGIGVIRKKFPLQKPLTLTIYYIVCQYASDSSWAQKGLGPSRLGSELGTKKVQVGNDQEKAQSERDSHSKNRGGKKPN